MQYRRLGSAGVKVSEIGLGGWLTFGNAVELEQGRAVMERALELGINFLDSANAYAGGRCEQQWGEILAGKLRSSFVLATKVFFPMGKGPNDRGLSRKHIMEQCHASLKRLQTDYIDLYQFHRHDPDVPLDETIRAVDDLIRQGKVLYWGFSQWPAELIEQAVALCDARGFDRPHASQPSYSLLQRDIEERVMPLCHQNGIGQVVYSPLAQGILTGKYKPGQPLPAGSRGSDDRQNQFIKSRLDDQQLLARVQKLEPIAREQGCTMAQLALAWILRRPEVSSCIIGATKVSQLEDNVAASGIKLSDETIAKMESTLAA